MKTLRKSLYSLLLALMAVVQGYAQEEDRTFSVINAANGLADNSAQIVMCTLTGRLIISTIGNLNFYDGKSFSYADSHSANEYKLPLYDGHYHLYFDHDHHIWLKDKGKVYCLNLMTERFLTNVDSVMRAMGCNVPVLDLFGDSRNRLWFVTSDGLFSPDYNRTYPLPSGNALQDLDVRGDTIYTFFANGEVVGCDTLGHVVSRLRAFDDQHAATYGASSVLLPYGDGFFQIRNGEKGAVLLFFNARENTYETVLEQDFHLNNMTFDPSETSLYIPSEYGYFVYHLDTRQTVHVPAVRLTSGYEMRTDCNAIAFDHQGGMWIGTEKRGVLYARPHSVTFRVYAWGHEMATKYAIMMDTLQQNISRYEGKRANCKYVDSRGWTWIGTRNGIFIEQPGVEGSLEFSREQGMNNDVVHAIIEDRDHNVWASTSCGITFFLVRDGRVVFVNNFTRDDNVPNESFENCKAMLLADGTVVMQGIEHVVAFNPSELYEVNYPHMITNIKPKLIKLLVNGNDIEPATAFEGNIVIDRAPTRVKHINLKSDQNSISLTFSALNYFRPMQTYYRVRVHEMGNQWKEFSCYSSSMVDSRGLLHFPLANLEPGDYHIEVQASMFPGVWEEDIPDDKRFIWEVHVKQPWWRTTGLFVLLGAVLLALMMVNFFLYNRNTRMRDRRNAQEGDIVRKIHHFVERCDAYSSQLLAPSQDDLPGDMQGNSAAALDSQFIDLMLKLMPHISGGREHPLTMRQMSDIAGMDIVQMYEVVTANLHKSPRDLVQQIRLRKGADLLLNTDMTIEQIAVECGFYTPNFFIGNFFHNYKVTPSEYRQATSRQERSPMAR